LSRCQNSIGEYISINTFFSARFNLKQIVTSLNEFSIADDIVRVLFEIDADSSMENSKSFAIITQLTYSSGDQQVLFMLGSIFKLIDVYHDKKNGLWIIKIVLASVKKEYNKINLLSCGQILQDMGKLEDAEKCYSRLLKEIPPNHEDFSKCYHSLGLLLFLKNDYNRSLYWYYELVNLLKSDDPKFSDVYYSIGCVYQKLHDYKQALEYYNKALNIWTDIYGDNEPLQMAECLNNMGCIYEIEKFYSKALAYHQHALSIRNKFQTDSGSTYNNIGNIYFWLGEYDVALENYRYSFEIKSKSLASQDPSLATTLANIGLVYEKDKNFDEALKFYKQAAFLFEKIFSSTHIYNIEIQDDIQRISSLFKSKTLV
jgi:tetratricopeptide (TPR) repeat protein